MQPFRFTTRLKQFLAIIICSLPHSYSFCQVVEENYPVDSASVERAGVPKGEIIKLSFSNSRIFPGTWREYWVYVPAQYRADKPACVYVNQDGIQFKAPTVFDNLIQNKEMPVTIGIFIAPGIVRAGNSATALDRYNRSVEYDGLGDAYARFVLEEILPEVEKLKTSDGRVIRLSKDGNDRAIGGSSSGAICAFTAAWERPEAFSRVFSAIGTYVGLRGGDRYHTLIRKYEPRPIRVFLQDGSNDNNIYAGDWWKANETMERALVFSGYEVRHVWGEGAHNGKHGTAVFPQAMRWLWKDHPKPVKSGRSKNQFLADILIASEDWKAVAGNYRSLSSTSANAAGEVFFHDAPNGKTYKIPADGNTPDAISEEKKPGQVYFGPEGRQFVQTGTGKILGYNAAGKEVFSKDKISSTAMAVDRNANMFMIAANGNDKTKRLQLVQAKSGKTLYAEGVEDAAGLTLSPDQTQLYLTASSSHWVWIYQIQPDGSLQYKQRYGWLHVPDSADKAGAKGIVCDTSGRVYVATSMGVQVLDQTGRVNAILPVPEGHPSLLCFGGADFTTLFVFTANKIYRRKLSAKGVNSFDNPMKPVKPRL